MKILSIVNVVKSKQVEHVKNEKNILTELSQKNHPFIVYLYILEFINGGELFSFLRKAKQFENHTAKFYACEIISALDYLHSLSIIYRDLKPENLLLDNLGHLKITDFGFSKKLKDFRTWTLCGTPEYLSPEIIQNRGHNKAVDWWSLGILIYEMLVGTPPFYSDNAFGIYEKILCGKITFPQNFCPVSRDLIKKLLQQDRTKRLGAMKNGANDIKNHRYFQDIDWEDVVNKKYVPPIKPLTKSDADSSNYDQYDEHDWKMAVEASAEDLLLFSNFCD
ncbi:unnamed protein product [Diamesa hyperborea]